MIASLIALVVLSAEPTVEVPPEIARYVAASNAMRDETITKIEAELAAVEASKDKDRAKLLRSLNADLRKARDQKTEFRPRLSTEGVKVGDVGHLPAEKAMMQEKLGARSALMWTTYKEPHPTKPGKVEVKRFVWIVESGDVDQLKKESVEMGDAFECVAVDPNGTPHLKPIDGDELKKFLRLSR